MTISELQNEIIAELTAELEGEDSFSADKLAIKVRNAVREVRAARRYPPAYPESMVEAEMEGYYSQIKAIALYDYNKIGMDYQSSFNENSASGSFVDRNSLFAGIIPLSVAS